MKQEFLISRLDEPNIAYLYVMEVDQNLLNNIRVLCTRQPETLRYFVPQELFWKIRNGEPVAFTAECFDVYGRKLFTVRVRVPKAFKARREETCQEKVMFLSVKCFLIRFTAVS